MADLFPGIQAPLAAGQETMGEGGADAAAVEVDDVLVLIQGEDDALVESISSLRVDQADCSQQCDGMALRGEMPAQVPAWRITDAEFSDQSRIINPAPVEITRRIGIVIELLLIKSRGLSKHSRGVRQNHVIVISHRLWQQAYGGNPSVIGSMAHLDGAALTIIGVAPSRFDYPGNVDVWAPTVFDFEVIPKHGAFIWQTIGRLRPGLTMRQARQEFQADVARVNPKSLRPDKTSIPELVGLRDQLSSQIRTSVLILSSVVLLVLLTAFANVAQLLLSRTAERHQELALRSALGASRSRLIQQLTVEASALTLSGAALGMIFALLVARVAGAVMPAQLATQDYTPLDWHVLCFAIALALITGFAFGIMPTWLIGRIQPSTQVVRMHSGTTEPATGRLRSAPVSLQVAFTLILLVSSFTIGSAFLRLVHTDLGFQPANAVTLKVSLEGTRYQMGGAKWQYYSAVEERLQSIPGVKAVGAVNYLPLSNNVLMADTIQMESGPKVSGVVLNGSMPGYFRAVGSQLIAGRDFGFDLSKSPEPPVIVNEAFARGSGFGPNIVGRRIIAPWTPRPYLVAGVVTTARMAGPEFEGGPQAYWPVEEEPPSSLTYVASVSGDPRNYLTKCRDAVVGLDRNVPVYPYCAENSVLQGGDAERGERSSP
jgi:putative ABC transport system permease protein